MEINIASPITPGSSGYSAAPTTPGSVIILLQFQQAIPGPNFLLLPDLESEKPLPLRHLPRHHIGGNSGLLTNFGSVEKLMKPGGNILVTGGVFTIGWNRPNTAVCAFLVAI